MVKTGEQAIHSAQLQHKAGLFRTGMCLQRVRLCFGIGAGALTAFKAWQAADVHHSTRDVNSIPRGVPVFWSGGSHGAGHIAISLGHGVCETTDFVRRGGFGTAHINDISNGWGLNFLGWTEDLNGVKVYHKPAPPKPPAPPVVSPHNAYLLYLDALTRAGKNYGHLIPKNHPARYRLYETVEKARLAAPKVRTKK